MGRNRRLGKRRNQIKAAEAALQTQQQSPPSPTIQELEPEKDSELRENSAPETVPNDDSNVQPEDGVENNDCDQEENSSKPEPEVTENEELNVPVNKHNREPSVRKSPHFKEIKKFYENSASGSIEFDGSVPLSVPESPLEGREFEAQLSPSSSCSNSSDVTMIAAVVPPALPTSPPPDIAMNDDDVVDDILDNNNNSIDKVGDNDVGDNVTDKAYSETDKKDLVIEDENHEIDIEIDSDVSSVANTVKADNDDDFDAVVDGQIQPKTDQDCDIVQVVDNHETGKSFCLSILTFF